MGRKTSIDAQAVKEKTLKWFEDYEPWYENPIEKQDKEGNVTTRMERIANTIPSKCRICKTLGVSRPWFYKLLKDDPKFGAHVEEEIRRLYKWALTENALTGGYNATFAIFTAKNVLGWTDKQDIRTEGELTHRIIEMPPIRKGPIE